MRSAIAGILVVASCAVAFAQPAQTMRVRGVIEKVEGSTLTVKIAGNVETKLTLVGGARIVAVIKASTADIKDNTFLGSAAIPQPDGTQKALEVHIFPEAMRGTGEGHRPYRLPNSTMTNGTISGATVAGVDGSTVTVKYKGGEQRIVVPPGTRLSVTKPEARPTSSPVRISPSPPRRKSRMERSKRTVSASAATARSRNNARAGAQAGVASMASTRSG
jgi:hypothetical protein